MNELTEPFSERVAQIEVYLEFLDGLDIVMKSGVPRLGGADGPVVTVDQQRMLFSSVYLQLYNLVEATVTTCLDAISDMAMKKDAWSPGDLTTELRHEWVKQMARTHVEMGPDKRLTSAIALCDHLVAALPVASFEITRGGGGNWDDDQITKMARRLGVELNVDPAVFRAVKRVVRDDLGAMALIVSLRNKLAHGGISFAECGQYDTAAELREIAKRVTDYMQEVVSAFATYISSYGYLRPDKRPVADAPIV